MTPENFCYWLQGFFEISGTTELTKEQVAMIEEHLQLVFNKQTGKKKEIEPMPIPRKEPESYCSQGNIFNGLTEEEMKNDPTLIC